MFQGYITSITGFIKVLENPIILVFWHEKLDSICAYAFNYNGYGSEIFPRYTQLIFFALKQNFKLKL